MIIVTINYSFTSIHHTIYITYGLKQHRNRTARDNDTKAMMMQRHLTCNVSGVAKDAQCISPAKIPSSPAKIIYIKKVNVAQDGTTLVRVPASCRAPTPLGDVEHVNSRRNNLCF